VTLHGDDFVQLPKLPSTKVEMQYWAELNTIVLLLAVCRSRIAINSEAYTIYNISCNLIGDTALISGIPATFFQDGSELNSHIKLTKILDNCGVVACKKGEKREKIEN
jgi:hypothetical protein